MKRAKVVMVKWVDATSLDAWEDVSAVEDSAAHEIMSCGLLVKEDKSKVILALNVDREAETCSCSIVIPKPYITSMKTIKVIKDK